MAVCVQFWGVTYDPFTGAQVYWRSRPASKNYNQGYPKLVNRVLAVNCLLAALEKSCLREVWSIVENQVTRIRDAGDPK